MELPPLSLYVHLPWCIRKCPYCDFNSHALTGDLPAEDYVQALLSDLEADLPLIWGRTIHSIFLGGGTPSLFKATQIETLLNGLRGPLRVSPEAEITLEANPGTIEHDSFRAYGDAGVNRFSLGVQSFNDDSLSAIGRIHGRREIEQALAAVQRSGVSNFNIDLMYGLPGQAPETALQDITEAIACGAAHVSHYQLTLEPNTAFHANPPELPDEDGIWETQQTCGRALEQAGFAQYEISAWSRAGLRCRHNLNYWRYGDFLGIGAGAHGKITLPSEGTVRRRIRVRSPKDWMKAAGAGRTVAEDRVLNPDERVFEFFLNQLRLRDGVIKAQLEPRTGVAWEAVSGRVGKAVEKGLLRDEGDVLSPTELGWRFSNETQALFLP